MNKWKKVIGILLALVLLAGVLTSCKKADDKKAESDSGSTKADAADLSDANFVSLNEGFTDIKVKNEKSAVEAAKSASDSLGMNNSSIDLKVKDVSKCDGDTYYRMQEYYNGVPVFGREVVLVADKKGKVLGLSSNLAKAENGATGEAKNTDSIDYSKLIEKIQSILEDNNIQLDNFKCDTKPEAVYYSADGSSVRPCFSDMISFTDANNKVYSLEILFDCDTYEIVNVDIAGFYANVNASGDDRDGVNRKFTAYREDASQYLMYDSDRNIAVFNANNNTVTLYDVILDGNDNVYYYENGRLYDESENEVFLSDDETQILDANNRVVGKNLQFALQCSASPNPNDLQLSESSSTVWNDPNAVSAVSRVQNAYDFYRKVLGRDSYNDKGGAIRVFYNDALNGDPSNAYSYDRPDMTALSFGADNNIAFDVVGHEFTHSVVGSIVNLPYRNQTGAINEAYADIFGEIIEDYTDGRLDNSCNWITDTYRNQIDPLSDGNPVVYKGENWAINLSVPEILNNTPFQILNLFTDNGGVHTNSTVLSHAAYLMNVGIDGDESKKIDTELLAKIWYKSMFMLHSDETFKQCAKHVYEAAQRTEGVTSAQLECIKEAFAQAGLEV